MFAHQLIVKNSPVLFQSILDSNLTKERKMYNGIPILSIEVNVTYDVLVDLVRLLYTGVLPYTKISQLATLLSCYPDHQVRFEGAVTFVFLYFC